MGWWKDANKAEDPDEFVKELKQVGRGVKQLGKAVRDEVRRGRDEKDRGKR